MLFQLNERIIQLIYAIRSTGLAYLM